MSILDRLSGVVKSYLRDDPLFFSPSSRSGGDPDISAAMDELNNFLNNGEPPRSRPFSGGASPSRPYQGGEAGGANRTSSARRSGGAGPAAAGTGGRGQAGLPPEALRADFAELEVPFGSGEEDCKAAYKRLLKKHHPDRHAGHEGNTRKATVKSARLNTAYDRIRVWREKEARQ